MGWAIRTAMDYKDCLDQIRQLTQKSFSAGVVTVGVSNTGDGLIWNPSASETSAVETWTITCTTAGGNDAAKFSVTGSVSGLQTEATAGVPYSEPLLSFILVAGAIEFSVDDTFSFEITASSAQWFQDRWNITSDYELIQHGIGGGSDEVYIGIRTRTNDIDYWNFETTAFTGYVPSNDFMSQPGYIPAWTCANAATFQFYVSFDSRRINFLLIPVEGSHEAGGAGWLDSYASPSQWAMPNFSGGSAATYSSVIGDSGRGNFQTGANLSVLEGNAIITGLKVSPHSYGHFSRWHCNVLDDTMRLHPTTLVHEAVDTVLGDLGGIYWPTPYTPTGGLLTPLALMVGVVTDYGGTQKRVCGVTIRNTTYTTAGSVSLFDLMGD